MPSISLFAPYRMGPHHLANRLVMNPMTRSRADASAVPTAIMATYYGERADAGLIITEGIAPSPNGRGYARTPGIWSPAQIEAWKPVTAAAHAKGGKIFAQFMHVGRIGHSGNLVDGGNLVSASALAAPGQMYTDSQGMQDHPVPHAMTDAEIASTKAEFVSAAKNAIAAGFDGVELHGANGYLLEQFLSPLTNTRTDSYGGSVANRIRFVVEVAEAVAAAIGGDNTGIRLSPYGMAGGMSAYPELDETYLTLTKALAAAGLVYIHIADHVGMGNPPIPEDFRADLRKAWPRTLIQGGSLDSGSAQAAVDDGKIDLAGFGRTFLANPDLVTRLKNGLALNAPDFSTFYTPGEKGYIDYSVAAKQVAAE